jgi:mannosyl-oligosaccharide alpha-1,2-mannosidase
MQCALIEYSDLASARGIIDKLLYISNKRGLLYVTDTTSMVPSNKLEHLSCFLPGLLALGVYSLPSLSTEEQKHHLWAAEGLAHTCWLTYADQASGLGPDEVMFHTGAGPARRWVEVLADWQMEGVPGRPPGTGQALPETRSQERGYSARRSGYFLRPEVNTI